MVSAAVIIAPDAVCYVDYNYYNVVGYKGDTTEGAVLLKLIEFAGATH